MINCVSYYAYSSCKHDPVRFNIKCVCENLAEITEKTPGSVFELSAREILSHTQTVPSTVDGKSNRVTLTAQTLHFATHCSCYY